MSAVAKSCRSLQRLGLRQCAASKLTITSLGKNCHHISCLNIAGIDSFTDDALSSLAENMPLLREIDASWNSRLSDNGIKTLLQSCVKLKKAVLSGLKLITSQPFLEIIGNLSSWRLLEELWRYNRKFQSVLPQGKVSLKACDAVSDSLIPVKTALENFHSPLLYLRVNIYGSLPYIIVFYFSTVTLSWTLLLFLFFLSLRHRRISSDEWVYFDGKKKLYVETIFHGW